MSRKIVEEVLGYRQARELWGAGYRAALPIAVQEFSLGSVLPAVLYMMRWGQRRGLGNFAKVYDRKGPDKRKATISDVVRGLKEHTEWFTHFNSETGEAVLGDLLLAYCLENRRHNMGRDVQVQRVFPTHYFSSWVDLPPEVANLRGIPELVVTTLARQSEGAILLRGRKGHFAIGKDFQSNRLLSLFGTGAFIEGDHAYSPDSLNSDRFKEDFPVGLDQLLAIRLAQSLGGAPTKVRSGSPEIPNQIPVATRAADFFYEDMNVFLRAYGSDVPRQSLLPMLEACLSVGLTTTYLSTFRMLLQWSHTGTLPTDDEQSPWPLFVDCSMSTDNELRRASEESLDDLLQRLTRLPACMMSLRVLDQRAQEEELEGLPPAAPVATARINFLGDLLFGRLDWSTDIERDLRRTCQKLAKALQDDNEETPAVDILLNKDLNPAWRLSEALVILMGESVQYAHYRKCLDSCLSIDDPNGLARKRTSTVQSRRAERRSLVLTNTALDFLVHRHLRGANRGTRPRPLSLQDFIRILRDRYGFYVDEAPPGLSVSSDLLKKNRSSLERRLRDLGLFVGVNDAEAMKRLRARFDAEGVDV